MKYQVVMTSKFEKDLKLINKRGYHTNKLKEVIKILASGKSLDAKFRDHILKGVYENKHECHIEPGWLLIYEISEQKLILLLLRTGTHSDLF